MEQHQHGTTDPQEELHALRERVRALEAELADHEHTRSQLQEQHSFRNAVLNRAAEGVCVCHGIEEHPHVRFTVWNDRMSELTGYTMEEINRLGWYQSLYPDPEVQERARERMQRMRLGDDLLYERWEITRADGEKRILGISTSVLTAADGATHVLALMQDVTDEEKRRRLLEGTVLDLERLLPICASCKQIRDEHGHWQRLESYLAEHLEMVLTHSICPQCALELFPDEAAGAPEE